MRKITILFLFSCLLCSAAWSQSNLLAWEFNGLGGSTSVEAQTVEPGINITSTSFGSGLTAINYLSNGFTATQQTAVTLETAISGNDYISFTVTPSSGKSVTIESIDIRPVSQNRERTFTLFSSKNGFSSGNELGSFTAHGNSNQTIRTITIAGHAAMETATEFRLYVHGSNNQYEAVGIGNGTGNDLVVKGTVTDVATTPTGYTDNFNDGGTSKWAGTRHWTVTNENGVIKFKGTKNAKWTGVYYTFPQVLNLSANPIINIKAKGDEGYKMTVYIFDVNNKNHLITKRVFASQNMHEMSFDLGGATNGLDYTQVKAMQITINGDALTWTSNAYFDDLRVGDVAAKKANLKNLADLSYYKDAGSKSILITDLENASSLSISGGSNLIENSSFTAISGAQSTWTFNVKPGATGTANITMTAVGASGYQNNSYTFQLSVDDNKQPTVDQIANVEVAAGQQHQIQISGLSDGDTNAEQNLTFQVSSSNTSVVSSGTVTYKQGEQTGVLKLTPNAGTANITLTVSDGSLSKAVQFQLKAFSGFNNPPTIGTVANDFVYDTQTNKQITLTGIGDGGNGSQQLTISAVSSDPAVLANPTVNYTQGSSNATLSFNPVSVGSATVTVTVTDNGGTASNNGNQSKSVQFNIDVVQEPLTGYSYAFSNYSQDVADELIAPSSSYALSYTSFDGYNNVLKINYSNKSTWDGIVSNFPKEIDITDHPFISFDAYAEAKDMWFHIYFYDANDKRNADGAHAERVKLTANTWTSAFFNFSKEGYLLDSEGNPINTQRITHILINIHDNNFSWPFSTTSGTAYLKNLKIGDQAVIPVNAIQAVIDGIPNQTSLVTSNPKPVSLQLTGISDGKGSLSNVSISVSSTNTSVANPSVSSISADGTATLSYTPGTSVGEATVSVIVSAPNVKSDTASFKVSVLSADNTTATQINVDPSTTFQTIEGFGTFYFNNKNLIDYYTDYVGASAMRIGFIGNQLEPVNDNDDPFILDRSKLNYNVLDWSIINQLKDKGVENFILTSWSPPAWMKDNLSLDYMQAGSQTNTLNTDNRLALHYYEEFAESMVAAVLVFEEMTGKSLYGIGLQNEPAFHEPYASAILDPTHFVKLIKVVGARFAAEGITTKLYMPEQVFSQTANSMTQYANAVLNDPLANQYTYSIATHGYANDGVGEGQPDFSKWESLYNKAQEGDYPKPLWMTETHPVQNTWTKALNQSIAVYGALTAGNVSLWTYWSIGGTLFDEAKKKPTPGGYSNANVFKFVKVGAERLATTSGNEQVYAMSFKNDQAHGGEYATILINNNDNPVTVKINYASDAPTTLDVYTSRENSTLEKISSGLAANAVISLPAKSVTTIVGKMGGVSASGDGLYAQYYNNKTLTGSPVLTRVDETVNFSWGQGSPAASVNTNNFSTLWTGKVEAPVTGNYIFTTSTDDGVRLFVNGNLVIDKWKDQAPTSYSSAAISLVEGQKYDIRMEYYENGGGAVAKLSWAYPNQAQQIIPKSYLYSQQTTNSIARVGNFEENISNEVIVYPNPAKSNFAVSFTSENGGSSRIQLINLDGRVIYSEHHQIHKGWNTIEVNQSGAKQGIYLLRIDNDRDQIIKRMIIN